MNQYILRSDAPNKVHVHPSISTRNSMPLSQLERLEKAGNGNYSRVEIGKRSARPKAIDSSFSRPLLVETLERIH